MITNDPILTYPNYEKLFTLTTDASNVALGAVLSQQGHPICFASRTLNEHELHYSTTEKELLAMVWATKYFRPYLYGRKFVINSDHRPLQWLHNLREPNSKLQSWKIRLNENDFDVKYISGKENDVADALSRIKIKECHFNEESESSIDTIHSADEDTESFIKITERPLNVFKNQIKLIRDCKNSTTILKIFSNNLTVITYKELTIDYIKQIIKTYLLKNNTIIFMPNDNDFYNFKTFIRH